MDWQRVIDALYHNTSHAYTEWEVRQSSYDPGPLEHEVVDDGRGAEYFVLAFAWGFVLLAATVLLLVR